MEVTTLSNGIFGSNSYLLYHGRECAVIDCGVKSEEILAAAEEKGLNIRYIILTHGHVDHIFYAADLKRTSGAILCLHEEELPLYCDKDKNGYSMFYFTKELKLPGPDLLLKHGDRLPLGDEHLEIIHTPGHSPGCICVRSGDLLFSGDTLFEMSVGRTDLFGGSHKQIVESIQSRLFLLNGETRVFPGHGQPTTISFERENNPYV